MNVRPLFYAYLYNILFHDGGGVSVLFIPFEFKDFWLSGLLFSFIVTDISTAMMAIVTVCCLVLFLPRLSYQILQLPQCPDKTNVNLISIQAFLWKSNDSENGRKKCASFILYIKCAVHTNANTLPVMSHEYIFMCLINVLYVWIEHVYIPNWALDNL